MAELCEQESYNKKQIKIYYLALNAYLLRKSFHTFLLKIIGLFTVCNVYKGESECTKKEVGMSSFVF